jgi:nucleoside phosphorylase
MGQTTRISQQSDHGWKMKDPNGIGLGCLCVVTAIDIEFNTAARLLADRSISSENRMRICRGFFGDRRITVLKSELGAIGFAQRLANHLKHNAYDALIVIGLAGALDPHLRTGDAVVLDLCYEAHPAAAESNSREKRPAREKNASIVCDTRVSKFVIETLRASGLSCFPGAGVTVDRVITRAKDKAAIGARYQAVAVDMETYSILKVCEMFSLSTAALRIISDEADSDLPDFNRAVGSQGQMVNWRLAWVMVRNPIDSMRFLLNLRSVTKALKINLEAVLSA